MSGMMKLVRSTSCPSKILTTMVPTPAIKPMKQCGNCGGFGHNRRTCGVPASYAAICHPTPAPGPAHKTTQKQCGLCGLMGHNRRTCEIFATAKVGKTQKQCGHCGVFGHNRRTCPLKTFTSLGKSSLSPAENRAAASLASLLD